MPELYERVRKTPKCKVINEGNYLIGLESWKRKGVIIRPRWEQGALKRGRITPAVAVVVGAQAVVSIEEATVI